MLGARFLVLVMFPYSYIFFQGKLFYFMLNCQKNRHIKNLLPLRIIRIPLLSLSLFMKHNVTVVLLKKTELCQSVRYITIFVIS